MISIFQIALYVRVAISITASTYTHTQAISVYLFAAAALLLCVIILMIIQWRHQIGLRSRGEAEEISTLKIKEFDNEKAEMSKLMTNGTDQVDFENTLSPGQIQSYRNYASQYGVEISTDTYKSAGNHYMNVPPQESTFQTIYHRQPSSPGYPERFATLKPNGIQFANNYTAHQFQEDYSRNSQYDNVISTEIDPPSYSTAHRFLRKDDLIPQTRANT